jgi:hypothetical protein
MEPGELEAEVRAEGEEGRMRGLLLTLRLGEDGNAETFEIYTSNIVIVTYVTSR